MSFYEFMRDKNNSFYVSTDSTLGPDKHFHNCMEIVYVLDGFTEAHIDGRTYPLSPGQLCAVSCFSTHYYENYREGQYIICLIPHRYFREDEETFNINSFANPVINDIGDKPFLSILRILQNLTNNRTIFGASSEPDDSHAVDKQLYYLGSYFVNLLIQHCGLYERHRISAHVADAVRIIENEFKNKLTVTDICQKVGTTQKELSLNFKKTMNMSIVAYINQVRILEACKLIKISPKLTIDNVMLESGFKSTRNFLRYFKEFYGCTPTEYKNKGNQSNK